MSLLLQASSWNSPLPNQNTKPKKRISAMRELMQQQQHQPQTNNPPATAMLPSYTPSNLGAAYNYTGPPRVVDTTNPTTNWTSPVSPTTSLNISTSDDSSSIYDSNYSDDDGSGLADFKPLIDPNHEHKPIVSKLEEKRPLEPFTQQPSYSIQHPQFQAPIHPSGVNYHSAYNQSMSDWMVQPHQQPVRLKNDPVNLLLPTYEDKGNTDFRNYQQQCDEKLSRLLFLMEESRMEQTQYVGEEIALYALLGAFVIGVLDSFVQIGKFVR